MSPKDKSKKDDDETGSTGKSGQVEFRDFLSSGVPTRDDQLPYEEKKRLLIVHKESNENKVKKQKELRDQRKALREGKISLHDFRQGMGNGMSSQYKINPILADKAQFSGIDPQVNSIPNEHIAETNPEMREKLEHAFRLRYQPEHAPKFHPKPQFNK